MAGWPARWRAECISRCMSRHWGLSGARACKAGRRDRGLVGGLHRGPRNTRTSVATRCLRPASIIGMAAILPCIVAVLSFSFSRRRRIRDCRLRYGSSISHLDRFCEGHGLTVRIGNDARLWCGNSNVFRWHHDWPVTFGSIIHCVLMAVERWLYEKIDRGEDIDPWIDRILRESKSLAFAGPLFDVGKYRPALFAGVLRPLLQNWLFLDWDRQISTLRRSGAT